ncbi:MAG: hypothetical protein OES09_10060, partial [Gammaproteobacteria bacterium]|nr:hypothetical protein [Gammaproteobacteria bacterium]
MSRRNCVYRQIVDVLLSTEDGLSILHKARDVGLGGILLEAQADNRLVPGAEVEVDFPSAHRITARVAQVTDRSVALTYNKLSSQDVVFLTQLLQSGYEVGSLHTAVG